MNFWCAFMSFNEGFSRRVAMARNALGLTQAELAKNVGVVTRQIAAYEGGEAKPRERALHNLAAALGTTPEWLASGIGDSPSIENVRVTITLPLIPVISYVQASSFAAGEKLIGIDYIPAPQHASENSFAIEIQGDSMDSVAGVSFPEGITVIFDPNLPTEHGDFVLASLEGETTFKRLIISEGNWYLSSLNNNYPSIPVDRNVKIIAKAVHAQFDLRDLHVRNQVQWQHYEKSLENKLINDLMPNATAEELKNIRDELSELKKIIINSQGA